MKRSAPIKRSSPMRRKAPSLTEDNLEWRPPRRKAPRRVAKLTADDRRWRYWIHARPCIVETHAYRSGSVTCLGRIEQSHERNMTGLGLKAPERRSVPMCKKHHEEWEQHRGVFEHPTKEDRRELMDLWIAREQADFERMEGCPF